jgi:hypothetical protein
MLGTRTEPRSPERQRDVAGTTNDRLPVIIREVETPGEEGWSETLGRVLRPVVLLLLVGSCAWLLIDPPSFSGVPTLLLILLGAALITLAMAWIATRMIGEELPEAEWRKIVDRSELLAQLPAPSGPPSAFDELVIAALDDLPAEFQEVLETVPVTVSSEGYKHGA